jgi:hypothetical protein
VVTCSAAGASGDKDVSEVPKARHKRAKPPRRRRIAVLVVPAAAALLPAGVAAWPSNEQEAHSDAVNVVAAAPDVRERAARLDRGGSRRQPLTAPSRSTAPKSTAPRSTAPSPKATRSKPRVTGYRYAATALNVRTAPSAAAEALTVLARGTRIGVTGNTDGNWVQVVHDGAVAWVNGRYLSESKPAKPAQEPTQQPQQTKKVDGISFAPCPSGSEVENGLTPDAVRVHRAVCARFPDVSSYGGRRSGGGEHSEGRALDIMVGSSSLGDAIASWVRANHTRLGVSEVIWEQRIWTVQRASEGWRLMADRGSVTANHYDHVHVTVHGDAGS